MKINRSGATPIHAQIQLFIRKQITNGKIKSGSPVPSERELAEQLCVSRMTVRQAMTTLREEGLIYQKRGKGTFVSPHKLDIHTRSLSGFSDEMQRRGMKPVSKILEMRREDADRDVAEKLNVEIGSRVFRLERLRIADEIPMSVETAFLPAARFAGLEKYDYEKKSLYQILISKYGVNMVSAEEILEAAVCDAQTSKSLGVKKNSPLLIVHRTVFTDENEAVEYTKSIYRADRYRAAFLLVKK